MGTKPSGPWRRLADGEPRVDLGPYEAAPHLFKYAILYHGIAQASGGSIGPDVVDQWESWQCAGYLGVGLPTPNEAMPGANSSGRDVNAEHFAYLAAQAEGREMEPPVPDAPDVATQQLLMQTLGGG